MNVSVMLRSQFNSKQYTQIEEWETILMEGEDELSRQDRDAKQHAKQQYDEAVAELAEYENICMEWEDEHSKLLSQQYREFSKYERIRMGQEDEFSKQYMDFLEWYPESSPHDAAPGHDAEQDIKPITPSLRAKL